MIAGPLIAAVGPAAGVNARDWMVRALNFGPLSRKLRVMSWREAVPVPRPPRFAGESKAYSLPVIGLAFRALFAHSYLPLRLITLTGIIASFLAVVLFIGLGIVWLTRGVPFAGFGSIMSLVLLGFGILTLMLGVIAEYLSLVYEEVKRRPNFVVRETVGL